VRFLAALLAVALLCAATALQAPSVSAHSVYSIHTIKSAHGCAPPIPPAVPGSPAPAPATPGIILINEVLLVPHSVWNCSEAKTYSVITDAWIELYNPQNQPFNLYASRATIDTGPNSVPYYFPFGSAIAPNGFLVLFPGKLFSSLFLGSPSPEMTLRLVIGGVAIDQVTVPSLAPDQSYARIPDGGSTWELTGSPTIGASNTGSQSSSSTSSGSSGSGSGNSPQALVNGTQPAWSSLTLPSSTSATATPDNSSQNNTPQTFSSTPTTPTNTPSDLPRRILLTVLVIALALSLFWCWRLFTN